MLENYEDFGNLKVYGLMSMSKDSKVFLKQTPEFRSVLEKLGYHIVENDTELIRIAKKDTDPNLSIQSCVIYDYSRVCFTGNDIELLKLIYTFVAINPPNAINDMDVTYENYSKCNFPSLYITKKEFISLLGSHGYLTEEKPGVIYIFKNTRSPKPNPIVGYVSKNHCFNMDIHDVQLLILLFRYSLTPISER